MPTCPNCDNGNGRVKEDDAISLKLLLPSKNRFSVHEWHYFISGWMLSDIKWLTLLFFLFVAGKLSINL